MNDATIRARDAGVAALLERVRRAVAAQPASAMNAVDASLAQGMRDCLSSCPAALARDDDADGLFDCDVGITDVDCAIADSGSLVISTIGRMRNAWITPPIHLAIVFESQILADLVDLFESRNECTTAASTTIITGPSKTADIEGVLVTGVHGPAYVEIVLVADESKHVADAHALIR